MTEYFCPDCAASCRPQDHKCANGKLAPFDLAFNAAVMTLARKVCPAGYDVDKHEDINRAPTNLTDLNAYIKHTGRILVDGRNSERTIFACPEHNWAFRAWHDWTHWVISAPFTLDGELSVAHRQIEDLKRVFGHGTQVDRWAQLIMAEVYGQALYFARHGAFPEDQRAFDAHYLAQAEWSQKHDGNPCDYCGAHDPQLAAAECSLWSEE